MRGLVKAFLTTHEPPGSVGGLRAGPESLDPKHVRVQ